MAQDTSERRYEIPFDGKMITGDEPAKIGPNFQSLVNMRYSNKHPRGVGGMTKINTTAIDATYLKVRNGIHYRKEQPAESHLLVESYNTGLTASRIYQNTTAIPTAGDFSTTVVYTPTSGAGYGRWSIAPNGDVAYCNGSETCMWGGTEMEIAGFINYWDSDATKYFDFTEQLRNTSSSAENSAVMTKDTFDNKLYFYIGAIRPLSGFKLYVKVASSASTMSVYYWDGNSWEAVSSLSDGTVGLTQTGTVSFSSTATTAKLKYIKGIYIYWYKVVLSAMGAGTALYYATATAPFQTLKDIWSGENFQIDSFKIVSSSSVAGEATLQVREDGMSVNDAATFIKLDNLSTGGYLACGFSERMTGCFFNVYSGGPNATDCTVTVSYWSGAAWVSAGTVDDGTSFDNASLAQSGAITWDLVSSSLERKRNFENGPMLYYYKFNFSAQLDADVVVYWITGIPAQKDLNAYRFPLLSNDRLFLCCNTEYKKNSVICSAAETSSVFNGADSVEYFFGDESEMIGGAWIYSQFGSNLFNVTLFFKKSETWALVGTNPEDWTKYRVSGTVGCPDPETIKVVDVGGEGGQSQSRSIAVWRSANGIFISEGRTPIEISQDIKDVFDKREANYINNAVPSRAFWDSENREYHWLFATGANTSLNKEYVFSFSRYGWFEIDRTSGKRLQLGIETQSTTGVNYVYGFIDTGYAERLEYGNSFDGTAIEHTLQFGDIAIHQGNVSIETTPKYCSLVQVAKETTTSTVAITHYGNGSVTGDSWTAEPTKAGSRLAIDVEHRTLGRYVFHSWKFVISTSDEAYGFEPLYFYVLYDVVGDYKRDRS